MRCPSCARTVSIEELSCPACGVKLDPAMVAYGPAPSVVRVASEKPETGVLDVGLAVATDIGLRHRINDDAGAVARTRSGQSILVVADGVSSSWNARAASAVAVRVVCDVLLAVPADTSAENAMHTAIASAHRAIRRLPLPDPHSELKFDPHLNLFFDEGNGMYFEGPECTIVAAFQHGLRWTIGWVGDSRAYLIDDDREQLLTRDDSWVEEVVTAGAMTRLQASLDRRAHTITQALGMNEQIPDIHVITAMATPEQSLLLCTDGLWNYLDEPGMLCAAVTALNASSNARVLCRDLIAFANGKGGIDNISVAVCLNQGK